MRLVLKASAAAIVNVQSVMAAEAELGRCGIEAARQASPGPQQGRAEKSDADHQ